VRFTPQDEEFRAEVRDWLNANLTGEFAGLRGAGGLGREHERHDERLAWNRHLAAAGWTCLGWPAEHTAAANVGPGSPDLDRWQRLFLFSRAETIYGGSDEIQHEIIATRALGLPRS
jgi:alkylation response protein AidB-like acyl-CoA dehydrogenase